jgi:hypothetical protein
MSQGKPQRHGTQFVRERGGVWKLHEVDPTVTTRSARGGACRRSPRHGAASRR